jgi:hypothetical protein
VAFSRKEVGGVSGDVLMTLAQFAGQTVTAAAITDAWESARARLAKLLGRGDAQRTQAADGWLRQTHEQLAAAAPGPALERASQAATERWAGRFAEVLDEDPALATELRALVNEVAAQLQAPPVSAVLAAEHSVAAGRDVRITASGSSVAAVVVHGNVTMPVPAPRDPTPPGRTPPDPTPPRPTQP